jgi:hypothetical protein
VAVTPAHLRHIVLAVEVVLVVPVDRRVHLVLVDLGYLAAQASAQPSQAKEFSIAVAVVAQLTTGQKVAWVALGAAAMALMGNLPLHRHSLAKTAREAVEVRHHTPRQAQVGQVDRALLSFAILQT